MRETDDYFRVVDHTPTMLSLVCGEAIRDAQADQPRATKQAKST